MKENELSGAWTCIPIAPVPLDPPMKFLLNFKGTTPVATQIKTKNKKEISLSIKRQCKYFVGGDWLFLIREALKETASEYGMQANFMSKPLLEQVKCPLFSI